MKSFFITVLLTTLLLASENTSVEAKYNSAISAYKAKDFKKSYSILSKLYLTKLSDSKLNFYLGRSAFETGNYEVALAAYERVEMLDAGNLRNKLEMARTYFMLKMFEDAEMAFKDVLQNPNIPQNVRTNIEFYLSKVTKVQNKSFTYATVNVDFVYDSNVNYGSLDSQYNVNVSGTNQMINSEPVRSDTAFQVYAEIVNIYDIGSKNGFAIKNKMKVYLKDYQDLDAYNIDYFAYTPSLLYKERKFLAELEFGFDVLKLGDHKYLDSISASPRFEYNHNNTLKSITFFKFQKKDYVQEAQNDLDASHYEFSYAIQNILSPHSYVQADIRGIREKKEHGERIDVDYDEYRLNLAYVNQFTTTYGADFFGEYRKRAYEDFSSLFNSSREDDAINVGGTLNAKIVDSLRVHLKANYNRVDSNQERYSYHKHTLTLGLNKTF